MKTLVIIILYIASLIGRIILITALYLLSGHTITFDAQHNQGLNIKMKLELKLSETE